MNFRSADALVMITDELIGSVLVARSAGKSMSGNMEYAALVRCAAYTVGGGTFYGTHRWSQLCDDIKIIISTSCRGYDSDANRFEIDQLIDDAHLALSSLRATLAAHV